MNRNHRLTKKFFAQPSLAVAEKLLGKYVVRRVGKKTLIGKIVETEAYPGPYDRAAHSYRGRRTPRTEVEWLAGGHIYIYLVYGMYWQLNITTGRAGYPECVLIRALEPIALIKVKDQISKVKNSKNIQKLTNGPGKLCRWLNLNKSFYGEDVTASGRIWLTRGKPLPKSRIAKGPRINIDYAGKHYAGRHWRFYVRGNPFVSRA